MGCNAWLRTWFGYQIHWLWSIYPVTVCAINMLCCLPCCPRDWGNCCLRCYLTPHLTHFIGSQSGSVFRLSYLNAWVCKFFQMLQIANCTTVQFISLLCLIYDLVVVSGGVETVRYPTFCTADIQVQLLGHTAIGFPGSFEFVWLGNYEPCHLWIL